MSVKHELVTAEELAQMPEIDGKNYELIDGEVVEVSPVILRHAVIVTTIARLLDNHVAHHDLGIVATGDPGFVLRRGPDTVRAPDVSFLAWDNPASADLPERGFSEGAPTLAVEVVSPDDRKTEIHAKAQQFLDAGTRQVWVLWPVQRVLTVYDPDGTARELDAEARLDGGAILPGFCVRVGDLFEVRRRRKPR